MEGGRKKERVDLCRSHHRHRPINPTNPPPFSKLRKRGEKRTVEPRYVRQALRQHNNLLRLSSAPISASQVVRGEFATSNCFQYIYQSSSVFVFFFKWNCSTSCTKVALPASSSFLPHNSFSHILPSALISQLSLCLSLSRGGLHGFEPDRLTGCLAFRGRVNMQCGGVRKGGAFHTHFFFNMQKVISYFVNFLQRLSFVIGTSTSDKTRAKNMPILVIFKLRRNLLLFCLTYQCNSIKRHP